MIPTLSLWQPWAAALVVDHPDRPNKAIKGWETRGWKIPPKYIGQRMLIYASKKDDKVTDTMIASFPLDRPANQRAITKGMHYGAIIGSVIFRECITTEDWLFKFANLTNTAEQALGDYTAGRFAWRATDNVCFDEPVYNRGFQKIYGTPISQIPLKYQRLFV